MNDGKPVAETNEQQGGLLPRVVSLAVLVIVCDFWAQKHLGIGLTNPGWLAGITAFIASAIGVAESTLLKQEKEKFGRKLHGFLRRLLSFRFQAILYLLFVTLAFSLAAVVIIPDDASRGANVSVEFLDSDKVLNRKLPRDGAPGRILVATTPFGRPIIVKSQNFLARSFDVYPLTGRTVRLGEDLQPAPSVIFRPHWKALRTLENGGSISVSVADTDDILAMDSGTRASFIVGTANSFKPDDLGSWRLELAASETSPKLEARTLLEWSRPVFLAPARELEPGMVLEATIKTASGSTVAQTRHTLGRDRLADVPIAWILSDIP